MSEQEALFLGEKAHLKDTIKVLEMKVGEFTDKTRELEAVVDAGETTKRELYDAHQTANSLNMILEEKELSDANQKEMIQYLQERLNDIDKANEQMAEEKRAAASQLSSHQVLKAEQDALLNSLRVSLQEALDNSGKLEVETAELRMFKDQHEGTAGALEALGEECEAMRDKLRAQVSAAAEEAAPNGSDPAREEEEAVEAATPQVARTLASRRPPSAQVRLACGDQLWVHVAMPPSPPPLLADRLPEPPPTVLHPRSLRPGSNPSLPAAA